MIVIQKALHSKYKRTYASANIGGMKIGFTAGDTVNVLLKDDSILMTKKSEHQGYQPIRQNKVYLTQNRDQVQLPMDWFDRHMKGNDWLKVDYTKDGLFISPFRREEFENHIL